MKDYYKKVTEFITAIYLSIICVALPLYTDATGYQLIGKAKVYCFNILTGQFKIQGITLPWILIVIAILAFAAKPRKPDVLDWFMIGYGIIVCISAYFCIDHVLAMEGYPGWNLGLLMQISFLLLYFIARSIESRLCRLIVIMANLITSSLVAFLAFLNNFGLYYLVNNSSAADAQEMVNMSTIGNADWFSGYLAVIAAFGLYCYIKSEHIAIRITAGVNIVLIQMAVILSRRDSIMASMSLVFLVLFLCSLSSDRWFRRTMEILLAVLISWRIAHFLMMRMHPDNLTISGFGNLMSGKSANLILLIGVSILFGLYIYAQSKKGFRIEDHPEIRKCAYIVTAVIFVLILIVIIVASSVEIHIPGISYFRFDPYWGNRRGMIWMITVMALKMTAKEDPLRMLIGFGPDSYFAMMYRYSSEGLEETFPGLLLTNSHNELLTAVANYGVIGGLIYSGIFICAYLKCRKRMKTLGLLGMLAIAGYLGHNLFCFQTVVCTPFIFQTIGLSMADLTDNPVL